MRYSSTHQSVNDGSPAMLVSEGDGTITLVNEDGYQWTDPSSQWVEILVSNSETGMYRPKFF